jgi:hypothetical protein
MILDGNKGQQAGLFPERDQEIQIAVSLLPGADIRPEHFQRFHAVALREQGKLLAILHPRPGRRRHADLLLLAAVWYAWKKADFIDACNAAWRM